MTDDDGDGAFRASPLLRSKLRRPSVPDYFVARARLERALDAVPERPLTVVIAPAGSGKTQLLTSWAGGSALPTAWLSLEEMDDDPIALWTGVVAALDTLVPGCGRAAHAAIGMRTDVDDVVGGLLESLERVTCDDAVLVLDDVHHVEDAATATSLAVFVQHLPAWLHIVMAGRTDPILPLDRLRVRGQLAEMRFPELRFTPPEAAEVLARLAPELPAADIAGWVEYTDGWAAGLQLVGLSARSARAQLRPMSARENARLLTEDYVWHEVLAMGEPDVVQLLMELSVVDRVDGALAAAITGRPEARQLLLRGEAQGLFVYRLGTDDWFRVHPLVREQLYAQLVRSGRHREHHERAASWLEGADETVGALDQWLLAERPREALRLLARRSADLYEQGREAVIDRTLSAIPHEVAAADLPAMIDYAVSHVLGPLPTFLETVHDAMWRAERTQERYSPQLEALHAVALTMSGDWTAGESTAQRAIADFSDGWWSDPAGRFAWSVVARGVALSERWADEDPSVRDATVAMRRDPRRGISLEGVRALGHAFAGRPIDALRVAAGIRHAAPTMSILRVELALAEAIARLEIGDRARARAELRAIADRPAEPRLYAPVAALLALADAAVDDGELDAAADDLGAAEALIAGSHGGLDLVEWARRTGANVALAGHDVERARLRVGALTDPFWAPVGRARLGLATGDRTRAVAELALAEPRCPRHHVVLGLARALAAAAPEDVAAAVAPVVEIASAHDMVQTVVGHGRDLADAIERAAWRVPAEWLHRLRLAMAAAGLPPQLASHQFPELLTDRERDVLRLLPSRLTVGEIASELYVSVNTVKFHLRLIYRKLGVNSREEAAAIARSMTKLARTATR